MRAKGRYVWQGKAANVWFYEARVVLESGEVIQKQRRASTKADAQQKVEDLYRQLMQTTTATVHSLSSLLDEYKGMKSRYLRESTLANNVYLLQKYVLPALNCSDVKELQPRQLLRFFDRLEARKLRVGTLNKIRAVIHALLSFGVDFGYLDSNPMTPIKPFRSGPEQSTQVETPWSLEEARSALSAASGTNLDFFVHATLTYGLRKGEVLALRWSDVDFEKGEVHIRRSRSFGRNLEESRQPRGPVDGELKTRASRRDLVLTSPIALALMRERERQEQLGLNFEVDSFIVRGVLGGPMSDATLRRAYDKLCKDHGLRRIRIHDHRHTAAVLALEAGASPIETSYGLGHSSFEITKRLYAAQVPKLAKAFSETLSDALWELPEVAGGKREGVGK